MNNDQDQTTMSDLDNLSIDSFIKVFNNWETFNDIKAITNT